MRVVVEGVHAISVRRALSPGRPTLSGMGSRYDVAVFRDTTLAAFADALSAHGSIGAAVRGPWEGPSGITVAEVVTDAGRNVVVAAPSWEMPEEIDARLGERLGGELLLASVSDSAGAYRLEVVGPGVDRWIEAEAPVDGGEPVRRESGARLPEGPSWPELDESTVQTVFVGRCGIDPGRLDTTRVDWFAFDPGA